MCGTQNYNICEDFISRLFTIIGVIFPAVGEYGVLGQSVAAILTVCCRSPVLYEARGPEPTSCCKCNFSVLAENP